MKTLWKVSAFIVAITLCIALIIDIAVRIGDVRRAENDRKQLKNYNELLLRNAEATEAQNVLLRENKMCIAFQQNGPRPLIIPEN